MIKTIASRFMMVLCLGLALQGGANAATLTLNSGALNFNFVTPSNIGSVNGAAVLDFNDPSPLGTLTVTDNGAAFPNAILFGVNNGATELIEMTFNFASLVLVGNDVFIPVTATPSTPLTDPFLISLLAPSVFQFTVSGQSDLGGGNTLTQFSFVAASVETPAAVPEPATWMLTAAAGMAALAFRRRVR